MFGKKRDAQSQDKTTRGLQSSGVYTIGHGPHPYLVGNETVEAVKSRKIYSFWSGVWYTTVLSILLFWFPPFGQMLAGYVGGRKTGSPRKGALAALVPMSIIFLLFLIRQMGGFVAEIGWFLDLPSAGADFTSSNLPVLGPVFGFIFEYLRTFISTMWSHEFFIYPYILTVICGYIGGILSLQHRREMEAEGADHPFQPIAIVDQPPAAESGVQMKEMPTEKTGEHEVAIGKVPKGWNMKKDKKKGKW